MEQFRYLSELGLYASAVVDVQSGKIKVRVMTTGPEFTVASDGRVQVNNDLMETTRLDFI